VDKASSAACCAAAAHGPPPLTPTHTGASPPPQNVVELLDDLFARAAAADEDPERNYIRKHALSMQAAGVEARGAAARLFSNPAGDYGSMVNERVGASNWESSGELGDVSAGQG
jgi:magnesium chelatase subunit H